MQVIHRLSSSKATWWKASRKSMVLNTSHAAISAVMFSVSGNG